MSTQLFAVRLGEFDIPVFEVRPGIITTDMTSGVKEKYDKLILMEDSPFKSDGDHRMMWAVWWPRWQWVISPTPPDR